MILPLRRRHLRMFAVMGVLLPVAFVAGIAARKPIPITPLLSSPQTTRESFPTSQWDRTDLFAGVSLRVQLLRGASNTNRVAISISAPKNFVRADMLAYWLPAEPTLKDHLPDDSVLLGAFISGQVLPIPPGATGKPGMLVLYSLADHETIAVSKSVTF